ncbi:MAG TPA: GGDEF domain-containing protein [Solirubrobacteraceae bacterium]|jgi:diguanylate cyclase (GGDEF)-like protein|nr:GGDEF domain-containing protein [Solirubrobacteraceae bacterium]
MTPVREKFPTGLARGHLAWTIATASLALLVLLGTLSAGIVYSRQQSRAHILSSFELRGTSSATFVSEFLMQQATREQQTAQRFLSGERVSSEQFRLVVSAFGSNAAVLLDSSGRLLDIVPSDPSLLGHPLASRYTHLETAEHGQPAISNVVASAARATPVTAIAVPFATARGRRVFSTAYNADNSALGRFVQHTVPNQPHEVILVDGDEHVIAASPATTASTLAQADPGLARAATHASHGSVAGAHTPTTFAETPVPGTSWKLLIAVPNSRMYASIAGWTQWIPWLVLVLVSILGTLLVALFARSLADRARLTLLSTKLEQIARTDSLTGLLNRRALGEHLARAAAHARRRDEPLSLMMIDLDRFKETNDEFGHKAGDQVLCAFAGCLSDALRADDIYGRWGGDEFLVALPATDSDSAQRAAARLRSCAQALELGEIGLPNGIPFSIGVATSTETTPAELVREADSVLYEAKADGHRDMQPSRRHH